MPEEETMGDADCESGMFPSAGAEAERSLRERAQRQVPANTVQMPDDLTQLSTDAAGKLFHELRVHQIELELQNEELRRSQEELEVARERYFDLYDLAPVGYVTIGEKGLVLEANLTATGLLNVPRSALVKQPWTRFVHPEDQDVYFIFRRQLLLGGGPHGCELRLVKGNGEFFWAQLEARVSASDDGTRASRVTISDTSERKQVQEALKASEARHRALFETSPVALMTLAPPSWKFTSGNGAALAMFGARDEAELMSRTPWDYSPERQPDGCLSAEKGASILELAVHAGCHSFEWTCLRLPAQEFRATIDLCCLESSGSPLLQASVRDDSEVQKQRANAAQTERLASMGLLAASVGHEINNPLAYVLSNVESLAEFLPKVAMAAERCRSALGDTAFAAMLGNDAVALEPAALQVAAEQAREALDGARRITRISKVLSAFSRVHAEALVFVDVGAALEDAISMAFNEIRFRTKLVRNIEVLPAVWASEGKLSQVFLNLLINAAHATDEIDAEDNCITVFAWADSGDVFVEVKDTGPGISPENLTRIFEPFFSTKGIGKGSGLGLSICRNIVSEFGGDIRVESNVGEGASFIVRLPVPSDAPEVPPVVPHSEAARIPTVRGRVLVVDDEAVLRAVMERLLFEHEVVTASSGNEAKSILENDQDFDIIVCDLMMPVVSGMDVHHWLLEHNPDLAKRMVFVTGGAFGPVAAEYLDAVGNTKIDKPFDNGEFINVVSDRIRESKSEPPTGAGSSARK